MKLENGPHAPSTAVVSVSNESSNDHVPGESVGVKEKSFDPVDGKQLQGQNCVKKSCLRKVHLDSNSEEVEKKKVQWLDFLGKELVEIREFESRLVILLSFPAFCFYITCYQLIQVVLYLIVEVHLSCLAIFQLQIRISEIILSFRLLLCSQP